MKITVKYLAQIKQAAQTACEEVELARSCRVDEFLALLAERHGDSLRRFLLDDDGHVQPALLLFVGDEQVHAETEMLHEGDVLTVLAPMAGG